MLIIRVFTLILVSLISLTAFSKEPRFNPDIGVNLSFLNQNSSRDKADDGMKLEEVEIGLSSDVDTNFAAKVLLSVAKENNAWIIEPEEAYVETLAVPYVNFKIGKSKMPFGKHNQLHPHAFPFINAPLMNVSIFGEEGLNETAVGASALIPLPWFSEMTIDYTQGENENLFNSAKKDNKTVIVKYKNLFDITDSTTLEIGGSGAQGKNDLQYDTNIFGADLTVKWRPLEGGKFHSFEWVSEFLQKDKKGASDGKLSGVVTHLKYQMSQRWYGLYRYDYLGLNKSKAVAPSKRHTALFAFLPSEFSAVRFQYETIHDAQPKDEERVSLQLVISLGSHPAHGY